MTLAQAARWLEVLFALSLCIQTLEYWRLLPFTTERSVWSWRVQRRDLPLASQGFAMRCFDAVFSDPGFKVLIIVRLLLATALLAYGASIWGAWALLLSNLLLLVRWRGAFNGGSDFMTLVLTCGLVLGQSTALFSDEAIGWVVCLWYVSIHSITSYFMSGWVKLLNKEWTTGVCLPIFLKTGVFGDDTAPSPWSRRSVAVLCSWAFILWEALMPLALLSVRVAWFFCSVAVVFHFLVFCFFGLNRFFWAWVASLPAILYCATWMG